MSQARTASERDEAPSTTVRALQATLAAEHAAVYVLGAAGARTSRSATPESYGRILAAYRVHQDRREAVIGFLADQDTDPAAPEPGYDLGGLDSADGIERRARRIEAGCAATYAYLVASTTGTIRSWAIEALGDAAVREVGFGARASDLPGL